VIHQVGDEHVAAQQAAGFPFLLGIEPTIRALNGLWFHAARRAAPRRCRRRRRRASFRRRRST